jgi:hypothetical protein
MKCCLVAEACLPLASARADITDPETISKLDSVSTKTSMHYPHVFYASEKERYKNYDNPGNFVTCGVNITLHLFSDGCGLKETVTPV